MTRDAHTTITAAILAQLAAGPGSWTCPWHRPGGGLPTNAATGQRYRGVNILSLWAAEQIHGFVSSHWATYRQWSQLGAQVRKGARGTPILFYRDHIPADAANSGTDDPSPRFVAKASCVFNADQVDGAPQPPTPPAAPLDRIPIFDLFVAATGATIRSGREAGYRPGRDTITMPPRQHFVSASAYAATLSHELVHWSGHAHRLDRRLSTRFGSQAYAAEELIAELGSAFVLASLSLATTPHPDHAAYLANWLPLLRADPRALIVAAGHASRASDFLLALHHRCQANTVAQAARPAPAGHTVDAAPLEQAA